MKDITEAYYTHKEAREKLGMTRDAFNHYVKRKLITPTKIIGEYRYFSKREINGIARSFDAAVLLTKSPLSFEKATLETQEGEFKLAVLNFGEKTTQFNEKRVELLKKNPDMSYYVYDGKFMVASINIVPLAPEAILKFKDGERGWLLGDYVEQYQPGKPLDLIIIDCMTTTLAPENRRKQYAQRLFSGLGEVFEEWASQGIEISHIYACGGTPAGREILERAQFDYLGEPRTNRHIYELDIATAKLIPVANYRDALAEYKQEHGA